MSERTGLGSAPIRKAIMAPHPYIWARSIAARPGPKKPGTKTRGAAARTLKAWTLIQAPGTSPGDFNFPAVHNSILPRVTIQFHTNYM